MLRGLPAEVGLLLSRQVAGQYGERIGEMAKASGRALRLHVLPEAGMPALGDEALHAIHAAFYSRDAWQGSSMTRPSETSAAFFRAVDAAPNLEWLHVTSSGVDLAQFPYYRVSVQRGLRITTSSGSNALPIAQSVVAAVLAHGRGFLHWMQAQREGRWSPITHELPSDLGEQTAVIVGMGPIGLEVGRLLKAIGMRTVGIRRNVGAADHFDAVHHFSELDALLPHAGFVVLACPLTEGTRGLLSAARLALLPRSASLINVGRGGLVDEAALIAALQNEQLRSAYLDVFAVEPLPSDSPLWRMPNVWITPHNSSASAGNTRRVSEMFLNNLGRWLSGKQLENEWEIP